MTRPTKKATEYRGPPGGEHEAEGTEHCRGIVANHTWLPISQVLKIAVEGGDSFRGAPLGRFRGTAIAVTPTVVSLRRMQIAAHHPFRNKRAEERYLERYALRALAWPVPSEERLITTSFGETFVHVSGPSKGPPLLLLPGVGSPSLTFRRMIGPLSEQYTTYAIDNIHDNGRSVETKPV